MKIYTRHGNRYVIDHNMHMITGENINPIYYYGEPNILLGFPASFQTDRGVWKTSAIVKIEESPKNHTYKLFSSTDKQLESFVSAPYADPQWMPDTCAKAAIFMPAQIPVCIRIWTSVMELESGNRPLHLQQKRKK